MNHPLFDRHRDTLNGAIEAIRNRTYWSAYPEVPSGKIYGETAKDDGQNAFESRLNSTFDLHQPGTVGTVGSEQSPYGVTLNISYPKVNLDVLLSSVQQAIPAWSRAGAEARVGVCLEILHRLNRRSFEMAGAVMHTTGQGFMMAFQAGGPHAQDRGLEAVAYAYEEMTRCPSRVTWKKQISKTDTVTLEKSYRIVPRGIAVVVGCSTFPTWNGYPGLFASLVTGNAVVVKPHPGAILPLAITVDVAREVLKESGFDPNLVTLVADSADAPITQELLRRPEVRIVDYTGGSDFGHWIEANVKDAVIFTEKAGVNCLILDSVDNLKAVTSNIAFTLSLYSGQMCTTPQNIFIPESGITVGTERISFEEASGAIVAAVDHLLSDPNRATEILGAIQNEKTAARIDQATSSGLPVLRKSVPVEDKAFPKARVRSPLILQTAADKPDDFMREMFGPISYIIATRDTDESTQLAGRAARELGAITCSVYSTSDEKQARIADAMADAGVGISCNLTGGIFVNQSAAFSDFHVSGANPAGNATLCDAAFVANRFRIVHTRRPV